LFTGDFLGYVDFLVAENQEGQFERDSDNKVIYEPADTKSARSARKARLFKLPPTPKRSRALAAPSRKKFTFGLPETIIGAGMHPT